MATQDQRLIERGFPCHQVGAETQRERDTGQAPSVNRLHVWWARRPLTPSRAALVASLDSANTDPEVFVRQLGIERVQALVQDEPWILTGELLAQVETDTSGAEVLLLTRVTIYDPETDIAAHVAQALEPNTQEQRLIVILDIDAYKQNAFTIDDPMIEQTFQQLRDFNEQRAA